MKELTLSQQYAVIAFDGLESLHHSVEKDAVHRAIAAAKKMEEILSTFEECEEDENTETAFLSALNEAVACAKSLKRKEGKELETELYTLLEADGVIELIPDILGCDMDYETAGVTLKAYRSEEKTYLSIREGLRAEILEDGEISWKL